LRTSWSDPDSAYDAAVERLVRGVLADAAFTDVLEAVVAPLVDPGRVASLAQVALHLTAPGVPDLYQGTESWDFSLVDPDNRRPVDHARLAGLLTEARRLDAVGAWAARDSGLAKVWLVSRLLDLRRRRHATFADGGYRPLALGGPRAPAALAFARADDVVTIVPRFALRLADSGWDETTVELPDGAWRGLDQADHAGRARLADILAAFPVGVLERVP
jgi:(1->4)-alpha-D-glucan 1-alpha-D-glucosylmutase